jgi:carbamoyltransferase
MVTGWLDQIGLGPDYAEAQIDEALRHADLRTSRPADLAERVAGLIADGHIVMWFQGRMEYGPRALGQRSVLARPDRVDLRDRLNLVLKQRVWYQPFCPTMLESEASRLLADYDGKPNRHMTMAYMVASSSGARSPGSPASMARAGHRWSPTRVPLVSAACFAR